MKTKLLIIAFLTSTLHATDANMGWVDQKIEEIKPQRHGLSNRSIASLKNPFIKIKPKGKAGAKGTSSPKKVATTTDTKAPAKTYKGGPLTLQMVLNSSALISGKWYKENTKVRGYTLTKIQNNSVLLEGKKKKIKLFIAQKNKNLNISTK